MADYPNEEFQNIYNAILQANQANTTPYPASMSPEQFQDLYQKIRNGMGDDATLQANLEAALRPMYDQSIAQLQNQRIANNAGIDVDAASRGMGNSTWVTDAKLQQLRNTENNIAGLNANYNAQLFNALQNAIGQRDQNALNQALTFMNIQNTDAQNAWQAQQANADNAYNQAWQWFQYNQQHKPGSGSGGSSGPTVNPNTASYDDWLNAQHGVGNVYDTIFAGIQAGKVNGAIGNAGAAAAANAAAQNAFSAFGKRLNNGNGNFRTNMKK